MRWFAALILCLAPLAAHAKPTRTVVPVQEFNGDRWIRVAQPGTTAKDVTRAMRGVPPGGGRKAAQGKRATPQARKWQRRPVPVPRPRPYLAPGEVQPIGEAPDAPKSLGGGFAREVVESMPSRWLVGIVPPLAAKAREIVGACGSKIISGVRHTYIAGTGGRLSLHASGRAVDIQGNPSCIYSRLHGWPGGYSTDYSRVKHVHISFAPHGPEWGKRFAHYRGGHRKRHKHRRRA